MMSWKNIKLIFQREVRDQLRDRRTLFMVAVLPLLLYPLLGVGLVQMTVTFSEQVRRVVVIGADQLPSPSLIEENRFNPVYFDSPETIEKLALFTDRPGAIDQIDDPATAKELADFLQQVEQRRDRINRLGELQRQIDSLNPGSPLASALVAEEQILRQEIEGWFSGAPAQVLIVFPETFLEKYNEISEALQQGQHNELDFSTIPRPILLHNSANEKSEIAYQRIRHALQNWEQALLMERLKAANLPLSLPQPVPMTKVDLAEPTQLAANVWSKVFPALLVIMSVTGAFYPAIDLGAGEKERGTMETLLISPASRTEIVIGKFLTVMLFSLSTALLNLVSMGFTGRHILSSIGAAKSSPMGDLSFPPLESLVWVVLLAIPLAALFSALSLSLAMFARSSKEGQYYLTPLLLVTMGLTMFCLNPAVELNPYYSVLPVTGPALLLKSLLLGNSEGTAVMYAFPVLLTSCGYSALALWWATEQFQREEVLFRESERFELGLWLKHLLREKEPTPSFPEAAVCFVMIAILQFQFLTAVQGSADLLDNPNNILTTQLIHLIATVGTPPVFMALLLTTNLRRTLKLTLPRFTFVAVGTALAITLLPVALELMTFLDPFFPPLPPGTEKILEAMGTEKVPLWMALATFALAPAVCEELAFRGFILSGLQRSRRRWLPIVLSALLFGVIHMIPKQQFNAALLGIVLGLLAVRSGSLLPGVIFHFLFNGAQVMASRVKAEDLSATAMNWLVTMEQSDGIAHPRFRLSVVIICGLLSAAMIAWLVRQPSPNEGDNSSDPPGEELPTPGESSRRSAEPLQPAKPVNSHS